jgi:hypothetical protein
MLAMASTLAGNLTITGSVANIIVVERAAAGGIHIGFREYVRICLPVTVTTLLIGSVWLWLSLQRREHGRTASQPPRLPDPRPGFVRLSCWLSWQRVR